ncbi:MAG: Cytochrome c551 peroxidase [uncultured Cytophagales bacterium]|uniref:Cytochrome c551 peroxidase n=1 Tax=uncultured Cytophagales bacterium TaxID=158755 RepID=A0A6J4LRD2_9SPHI|nr:MAG: Cytochrome c551 peroxidase [uncultured Cytophagales bacterium]
MKNICMPGPVRPAGMALIALVAFLVSTGYQVLSPAEELPKTSVQLGERLFKDPILSGDSTLSCASCHKPELAFADNQAFSMGTGGVPTLRNSPSVTYSANRLHFFWDGRAKSLEEQAAGPITNPHEMNLSMREAVVRVQRDPFYRQAFRGVFGAAPDSMYICRAIADFERTLTAYDSPYDRFLAGDENALSESALRGLRLFFKENTCANEPCHAGPDFSSDSLVSLGIHSPADPGLFSRTGKPEDRGRFKTPPLRNVAVTAPYMHDGSQRTLREVVVFYNDMDNFPIESNVHHLLKAQRTRPLDEGEIADMVEFMKALTDSRYLDQVK